MRRTTFAAVGWIAALGLCGAGFAPSARAEGDEGEKPGLGDSKERVRGLGTTRGGRRTVRGVKTQDERNKERARVLRDRQYEIRDLAKEGSRHKRKLERAKRRGVLEEGTEREVERAKFHERRAKVIKERVEQLSKQTQGTLKARPVEDSIRAQRREIQKARREGKKILTTGKERRKDLRERRARLRERERERKELIDHVRGGGKLIRDEIKERIEKAKIE